MPAQRPGDGDDGLKLFGAWTPLDLALIALAAWPWIPLGVYLRRF